MMVAVFHRNASCGMFERGYRRIRIIHRIRGLKLTTFISNLFLQIFLYCQKKYDEVQRCLTRDARRYIFLSKVKAFLYALILCIKMPNINLENY